jgi:hypothetical protein
MVRLLCGKHTTKDNEEIVGDAAVPSDVRWRSAPLDEPFFSLGATPRNGELHMFICPFPLTLVGAARVAANVTPARRRRRQA